MHMYIYMYFLGYKFCKFGICKEQFLLTPSIGTGSHAVLLYTVSHAHFNQKIFEFLILLKT